MTIEIRIDDPELQEIVRLAVAIHGKKYEDPQRAVDIAIEHGKDYMKEFCFKFRKGVAL